MTDADKPRAKRGASTKKEAKPIVYANLKGLKTAKAKGTLPRGLKVRLEYSGGPGHVVFFASSQPEPMLRLSIAQYAEAALKADGFKVQTV
jgi:hypothetical protein